MPNVSTVSGVSQLHTLGLVTGVTLHSQVENKLVGFRCGLQNYYEGWCSKIQQQKTPHENTNQEVPTDNLSTIRVIKIPHILSLLFTS